MPTTLAAPGTKSRIFAIARAVASEINANSWNVAVAAEAKEQARYDLADLATLRISVIPFGVQNDNTTRATNSRRATLAIVVQQKVTRGDIDAVDLLTRLVEDLDVWYSARNPIGGDALLRPVESEIDTLYDFVELDEQTQFYAVIKLTVLSQEGNP